MADTPDMSEDILRDAAAFEEKMAAAAADMLQLCRDSFQKNEAINKELETALALASGQT